MYDYPYRYQPYPQLDYNPVFYPQIHTAMDNLTSASTRQARNQAEKNRRDKLNAYITQLSTLVPIINYSPKKLDKTSILRLAATYIRLHNVVFGTIKKDSNYSQQTRSSLCREFLTSINWSENVLEDIGGGMMLIVTGAGKIIFISNAVEKVLGHTQIELMGHSLFSLTCLEDHTELKRNLSPNDSAVPSTSSADVGSLDDSDSDSSSGPSTPPLQPPLQLQGHDIINDTSSGISPQRRSFYIRLRQRAVSKSDHPQYELVHVLGHLRIPSRRYPQPSTSRKRDQPANSNDIILVAVARPFKEKRLTHLSLSEAYREEFITRHTVDGNIIYTDHRISTVSGYLAEEVVGAPGFKFMHKDDMRWTMIALRQMYFRGQSYGTSVYRLQSKTGEFIYIKTHGYLEINDVIDDVQSLLCINTLITIRRMRVRVTPKGRQDNSDLLLRVKEHNLVNVNEHEGYELVHKMKDLYTPLINDNIDTTISLIVENTLQMSQSDDDTQDVIEDAINVKIAIQHMLANIPSFHLHPSSPALDMEDLSSRQKFAQVKILAKTMPSVTEQAAKLGISLPTLSSSSSAATALNPIHSPKTPIPKCTPPPATTQLNRPSVLRHAPRPPNSNYQVPNEVSVVKRLRTDEHGHGVVVSDTSSVVCRAGVVVSAGKRKHEDEVEWVQPLMNGVRETGLSLNSPTFTYPQPPILEQPISPPLMDLQQAEIDNNNPVHLLDSMNYLISLSGIDEHSQVHLDEEYEMHPLEQPGNQVWEKPDKLDTELYKSHYNLGTNFEMQETQMNAIEQAIDSVPRINMADQMLNNSMRLTELRAELQKEKQTLITLRQDHQSIQHGLM